MFGNHFFKYCMDVGYDRVLRVLGGNLMDFLCNLDALHDQFDSIYPGMRAPTFRCTATDDGGLLLHYYSKKPDLHPIVRGIVQAASESLFNVSVTIEVRDELSTCQDHVVMYIHEQCPGARYTTAVRKRSSSLVSCMSRIRVNACVKDMRISAQTFCRAFPFHVMFNRKLEVTQAGKVLVRVLGLKNSKDKVLFSDLFQVVRPTIEVSFNSFLDRVNALFAVKTRPGKVRQMASATRDEARIANADYLTIRLKGQMVYIPESDSMLFLCSPRVCDLDDLKDKGLYLSDIPLHDATRDLILITQARRHERDLVEKLEDASNNLQKLQLKLEEDKRRTDELLHSILPSEIADKLRLNQPVDAEKYDLVTVLVADIVSFTTLCGNPNVMPIDIVRMLNKLYTHFDMLSNLNQVYKVGWSCWLVLC
ncbi:hypothetical protein LSH36_7g05007 [Paralvinella palmiformis]|uniref:guanylate cyclase n=1 Tax=Paralvinella palmiformis TaxID=53620 RepID=A0AAD9KEH7_9ANNE|nr:hypothetical protein LSH36_7g05007 [Paralvinella palmiformis]